MRQRTAAVNLRVLKRSRKKPRPGDVFVFQLKCQPGRYRFGRVIMTDASIGGFQNVILVYLYKATSSSKREIPHLSPRDLLIRPAGTNRLPWTRGYFETVAHEELRDEDRLPMHCFRSTVRGGLFDERGRRLEKVVAPPGVPVGEYGLDSYRTIDDEVSEALGVPLAPDV